MVEDVNGTDEGQKLMLSDHLTKTERGRPFDVP